MTHPTVLLADDDKAICTVLSQALTREGYQVKATQDAPTLQRWVEQGYGDAVITDVVMPSGNGLELLPRMKQIRPDLPVIVISAQNTLMTAVKATELGAFDYLPKPFDLDNLLDVVAKSVVTRRRVQAAEAAEPFPHEALSLVGTSAAMQGVYKRIARLASNDLNVLIMGESGTGKELVARALHQLGNRKEMPFVTVNAALSVPDRLQHEYEQQAAGGVLFVDEVAELPKVAQEALLQLIQREEGAQAGVRVIAATSADLQDRVVQGHFREDLYYRLNVVPLPVPPLRDRLEDVGDLVSHFARKASANGLAYKQFDQSALAALREHRWPGNVRELENLVCRLAALRPEGVMSAAVVQGELSATQAVSPMEGRHVAKQSQGLQQVIDDHLRAYFEAHQPLLPPDGLYDRMLEMLERPLIEQTLRATDGNQLRAAKILGVNRNTLRKKMQHMQMLSYRVAGSRRGGAS